MSKQPPEAIDRCDYHDNGTVDDAVGEGAWHLEDMGDCHALVVGEGADRAIIEIGTGTGTVEANRVE